MLLIPKSILFLLECWEGVWGGSSQHRAVWGWLPGLPLEGVAFKLHLSRAPPHLGIYAFKAPQAILMCDQLGGGPESQVNWFGSGGKVNMHITASKVQIIRQEVPHLLTVVSRDFSKSTEQSQGGSSKCVLTYNGLDASRIW